jgi:hypothetical protein
MISTKLINKKKKKQKQIAIHFLQQLKLLIYY